MSLPHQILRRAEAPGTCGLEISTDGQSLNIRPLHRRTLEQAKAHIKRNLGKAMEKLAK